MKLQLDLTAFPYTENWTEAPHSPVIFLTYLHRTPPHIAMVFNNHYHSYDLQKFDTKISLRKVLNFFDKKSEPVLGIVLKKHPVYSLQHLEEIYSMWEPKDSHPLTCLSPLLEFMNLFYPLGTEKNFRPNIPEFLNHIKQASYIDKIIFHKFNKPLFIMEFENYNSAQTQNLLEKYHVPERK